jgi:transcriptional regulator with XRE-family HTH domain
MHAFLSMSFYTILQHAMRELRISTTDLENLTGVTTSNIDWWKRHDESRPQRRVIERIEEGLGIVFEYGDGVRNVVGWKRRSDMEESSETAPRGATGIFDLVTVPLRDLVEAVKRQYQPSTPSSIGGAMDRKSEALYEALYRTLVRDLETIKDEAETKIKARIRDFENALDRHQITIHEQQEDTQ